jgi:pimeloyl-ACP methyl ester carboxylesterase
MPTGRRLLTCGFALATGFVLSAPLWAPPLGFGPRALPKPGRLIRMSGGYRLNVLDEGRGVPVVLVHGIPGSAYDWTPLPQVLLGSGFRVIRYDRAGYGHSDPRPASSDGRIDDNAADLQQLLEKLSLPPAVIVGWSYGGGVALQAARIAPERIRGVVLVASIGPSTPPAARIPEAVQWPRRWAVRSGFPARAAIRVFGRTAFSGSPPDWWAEHTLSVLAAPHAVHAWTREARAMNPGRLDPERVTVPVKVLQGTADRVLPLAGARDLHRRMSDSELVEVTGGSHMLPNTHAEAIVAAVRAIVP